MCGSFSPEDQAQEDPCWTPSPPTHRAHGLVQSAHQRAPGCSSADLQYGLIGSPKRRPNRGSVGKGTSGADFSARFTRLPPADQRFEAEWANLPEPQRAQLTRPADDYWSKASALQERTAGFWQSEDYAELQRLKTGWLVPKSNESRRPQ